MMLLLFLVLSSFFVVGAKEGCVFPEMPFFAELATDALPGTQVFRSRVLPGDAHMALASVRSPKLPHLNYTSRFVLERYSDGGWGIGTRGKVALPPFPSDVTHTPLFFTILCNGHAIPLLTLQLAVANRVAPRYYGQPYSVTIPRNSPVGTETNTGIISIDWDPSPAYDVRFTISDSEYFAIVSRPVSSASPSVSLSLRGWSLEQLPPQVTLRVIRPLDDLPSSLTVHVIATDGGVPPLSNTTSLSITLLDPISLKDSFHTTPGAGVQEGAVLALTPPLKISDNFTYSLVEEELSQYMSISRDGIRVIRVPPSTLSTFHVKMTRIGYSESSLATVHITADSHPRFSSCDFSVSLPENARPGTHVFRIEVVDRSETTKVHLRDADDTFVLDDDNIVVKENAVLDRERFDIVEFLLEIQDPSVPSFPSCQSTRVRVHLLDENDNSPFFTWSKASISIPSSLPNNTLIGKVTAVDLDQGDNGHVNYRLISSDGLPIRVTETAGSGELILNDKIETLQGPYYVTIEAYDNGVPSWSNRTIIEVNVADGDWKEKNTRARDQNRVTEGVTVQNRVTEEVTVQNRVTEGVRVSGTRDPVRTPVLNTSENKEIVQNKTNKFGFYEPSYEFEMYGEVEEGEIIGRVSAGPNAQMYGVSRDAATSFKVNDETGDVIVRRMALEITSDYSFRVSATDGVATAEAIVFVRVSRDRSPFDANPHFDQSHYQVTIRENEPPRNLFFLRAFHRGNSSLTYSLVDEAVPFYVDDSSGEVVQLAPLDRESQGEFHLKVRACLLANPSSCAFSVVDVIVEDVNDNSPILDKKEVSIRIPSDVPKGTVVSSFHATDKDSGENGVVSYAINPPSNTFAIDVDDGKVIVLGSLDDSHYELAVQAFDHGSPRRSDIGRLTVTVQGTNPTQPEFDESHYSVHLSSPVRAGQIVAIVHAMDPDPGPEGTIKYKFATPKNTQEAREQAKFSVNADTGAISSTKELSSLDGAFSLVVQAVDQSRDFPRTGETLVEVSVEEGSSLRFLPLPSTMYISQQEPIGSVLLRPSVLSESPVTYSIEPSSEFFAMNGTHLLVASELVSGRYSLAVRARSGSAQVDHLVTIVVMEDRNKYPVFSRLFYEFNIDIESKLPMLVHTFDAKVRSGQVEYVLFPFPPPGMALDETSGELWIEKAFLDSQSDTTFTVVRARNTDHPKYFSDVGVILRVTSSMYPLAFPLSVYRIHVTENLPVGVLLDSSIAIPIRSARIGVEYGIIPDDVIGIHQNGSLYVKKPIDLENMTVDSNGIKTYTVWAESGDQKANATLQLKINDVNEFSPHFEHHLVRVTVPESFPVGATFLSVAAIDEDFGDSLTYRIKGGNCSAIEVHPNGTLFVAPPGLDFEKEKECSTEVQVTDKHSHADILRVNVVVSDENDSPPIFAGEPYVVNVTEGESVGFRFTINDEDRDDVFLFRILRGNDDNVFSVTAEGRDGILHSSPLRASQRVLSVEASDAVGHRSTATIVVNVVASSSSPHLAASHSTSSPPSRPSPTTSPFFPPPLFSRPFFSQSIRSDLPLGSSFLVVSSSSSPLLFSSSCPFLSISPQGVLSLSSPLPSVGDIECGLYASDGAVNATVPLHLSVVQGLNRAPSFDRPLYVFNVSEDSFSSLAGVLSVSDADGDSVSLSIEPPEYRNLFDISPKGELLLRFPAATLRRQPLYSFIVMASDSGKPPLTSFANVKIFLHGMGRMTTKMRLITNDFTTTSSSPTPPSTTVSATSPSTSTRIPTSSSTTSPDSIDTFTVIPPNEPPISTSSFSSTFTSTLASRHSSSTSPSPSSSSISPPSPSPSSSSSISPPSPSSSSSISPPSPSPSSSSSISPPSPSPPSPPPSTTSTSFQEDTVSPDGSVPTSPIRFEQREYTLAARRDTMVGTVIGHVSVSARREGVEFMVGDDRAISVNEEGDILLRGPLLPNPYLTPVIAFMEGRIMDQAQLVVYYSDMPSSTGAPSLAYPVYSASVLEGTYANGVHPSLRPAPLSSPFADGVFSLEGESPFTIDSRTGELTLYEADREETPFHLLTVRVTDPHSVRSAAALLNITILDVNDIVPQFTAIPTIIGISRDTPPGSPLAAIQAQDADSGDNGSLEYSLQASEYFSIDSSTGMLSLIRPLDVDNLTLTLTVSDRGRPPLRTVEEVEIRVFSSPSPTLPRPVTITAPPNTAELYEFLATPNIGEEDPSVQYRINDSYSGLFSVLPSGTLVFTRPPTEGEKGKAFPLNVSVANSHGSDWTTVSVLVGEESSVCSFPRRNYSASISENVAAGQSVIKVSSDCEMEKREHYYSIIQHSDEFSIDRTTGEIRTRVEFDREKKSVYLLVVKVSPVRVSKRDSRLLSAVEKRLEPSQTLVIIRILDENDNAPVFKTREGKIVGVVDWQMPIDTPVIRIEATDRDENPNVVYRLAGQDWKFFSINSTSGVLYLERRILNEDRDVFYLDGISADGVHETRVPIEIYRLSPVRHLIELITEQNISSLNIRQVEGELRAVTGRDVHVLNKQSYIDNNGHINPSRTLLYVYVLDDHAVPVKSAEVLSLFTSHATSLASSMGITSISSPSSPLAYSLTDIFLFILVACLLAALLVIFCLCYHYRNKKQQRIREKEYMAADGNPRPYDVENISRQTAQNVLAAKDIPEARPENSPTSNRSDTTYLFSNSVRGEGALNR